MDKPTKQSKRRQYLVAMVLGTTLSAMGGAAPAAEAGDRAITNISRYCTACWRNARLHPDAWNDCTQEVLCRLLERVNPETWDQILNTEGDERRELIRAIDTVKKRTQRARKHADSVELLPDRRDPEMRQLQDDREFVRDAADRVLSRRQQRIVQMSLEGWSVHDMSRELGLPAARISDEKYKAVQRLRDYLSSKGEES
ncbi:MAG TPA: sigma-70 family RNA polymerase sigma factor [Gemmataceae bacterium]|jgi:RNA polymerase sigma factor (sigma-70 family)|nr:sigma-70 family RNA polymerase sigma factor [Gemmataceae bacterium]